MIKVFRLILVTLLGGGLLWAVPAARAQESSAHAVALSLRGPLTVPMADYLDRGLEEATKRAATLVIVQLDTPGGELSLMERMISSIRNSPVPVVVYVSPNGAMAGSAGTLITLAGHASGMAPETLIGAASPIDATGQDLGTTADNKAREALMAQARALTERRGPEAVELAQATIDVARAVTAREALEAGLIDVVAADLPDLLRQLDGHVIDIGGQTLALSTTGLIIDEVDMNVLEQVLTLLVNASVLSMLFSLGLLLLYLEVQTPGGWISGVVGAGLLLLALYGSGFLPVNWFGVIFIAIAFGLFVAEAYTPATFGALTLGGVVFFVVGSLVLFNSPGTLPVYRVSVPLVIALGVILGALSLTLVFVALRTLPRKPALGADVLVGQTGQMRTAQSAQIGSELWTVEAVDGAPLSVGDAVQVTGVRGLRLQVRKPGSSA
ncbi:MAG TPA: NfeD family protein [Anaerolineales bacterium]|nr:NfeD family protein [Anaerolineales bacterium]HRF46487.1 NfeD family protein [Anaerolineales bacterium]